MDFPRLGQKVKHYLGSMPFTRSLWAMPLVLLPNVQNASFDTTDIRAHQQTLNGLMYHQHTMVAHVSQPVAPDYLLNPDKLAVYPIDSAAHVVNQTLGFPAAYADSLKHAMETYRDEQGYKFFEAASRHNLHDMNIANQRFQSLEPEMEHALRAKQVIQSKGDRLHYPAYTKLPTPDAMAKTGQEELHRLHWKKAKNYASVSYVTQLTKAYHAGDIHDTQSWSQWNKTLQADSGYVPGAGAHVVELGAFAEQRHGLWAEEHQQLRGVNEGRHGTHSDHYAHKYYQYHSSLSKALDIFGPQRQYGRAVTQKLDDFYQYHVLPYRRELGVPEAVTDSVKSKTEDQYVNPGRAVWYFRGHYGDHIHVSMLKRCVVHYKGQDYLDQEVQKRQDLVAPFDRQNKKVPVISYVRKALPPHKNILVYDRQTIMPMDSTYQWVDNLDDIKGRINAQEKPHHKNRPAAHKTRKKISSGKAVKLSYQQNVDALRPQGYVHHWTRKQPAARVNYA
jgi:hypothetical protein